MEIGQEEGADLQKLQRELSPLPESLLFTQFALGR